ncbi:MAG: DUF4982 domain-containing protein [Verrucomicrobiota bacterium]|nr:DUF4982 domain-containing protein [Verrucomicrobiota bacterium]
MFCGLWTRAALADSPRERTLIDSGWRFHLGDPADMANADETNVAYYPEISDLEKLQSGDVSGSASETNLETLRPPLAGLGENVSFVQTNFDDRSWQPLNLPRDWVVELPFSSSGDKGHGYKEGINGVTSSNTIGWYRRTFTLPSSDAGKSLWLEFDGVYRNCLVWLNGHVVGRNVSGYSGFYFDVSQYANAGGTNVLVARVDASRFEGWFYEGAGIYRHVWLVATDPVHVAHWGTYVTNMLSGSNAIVTIQTQVANDGAGSATPALTSAIYDSGGNLVASVAQSLTIAGGGSNVVTQTLTITNAQLWSLDFPNLYRLDSILTQGSATNDVYETPFGVRTITWDPNNGMSLNGQRVEVKGACNHQDFEGVGLALPDRVEFYRIERLKALGFNAIRTSHNPPTPELLDACDRLGMLVMDENRRLGWDPEALGQLGRNVIRDRNHPSVFIWSLANEETLQGTTTGAAIMQVMTNLVHQLDPTRLTTAAMNGSWGNGFSTNVDVQGFNYHEGNEAGYHGSHPTQPTIATEDGSQVGDRGIYTNLNSYVEAYDIKNAGVGWSQTVEGMWQFYKANPWVAGFFYWTGFDYRGEPTPTSWPSINSHFGILDTCGFAKDNAWYCRANWLYKPVLHVFPHWNWAGMEGQPMDVWAFSNCQTVELFLNGVSQGRQTGNVLGHLEWSVPYAAGTLQAVGYIGGQPVITNTIVTTGSPAAITLQPDRGTILADGRDVSLVTVSVVDAQGNVVPTATNTVTLSVSGGGTLLGLGNGDPNCHESDVATNNIGVRSVFNGLGQVIVQSLTNAGSITLTASGAGLTSANVTLTAANVLPAPAAPVGLVAVAGNQQVTVGWDLVPGAITYNVKRATTSGGPYTTIASNTADLGLVDGNVVNGTTYYYVVSAFNADGESVNSSEASATPQSPFYFLVQPNSFVSSNTVYVGTPIVFSAMATNNLPVAYQWFEILGDATNILAGQTNASYSHLVRANDVSGASFFVVAGNGSGSITSSVANLVLNNVSVGAPSPAVSVQFTLTNYSGYSGFFLSPSDTAGVYAVSNWNVWPITPVTNGTQPGVTISGLKDFSGAASPISVTVANVSDGWHQSQATSASSPPNQRLMNTFWKVNPKKSNPSVSTMGITLRNVPNGGYSAYIYFMQNISGATGSAIAGATAYYFAEFTAFNASSNFVTSVSTDSGSSPLVNYLELPALSTGGTNSIQFYVNYINGGDGIAVCGLQLVPLLVPPTGVTASVTNGRIDLSWISVAGATSYNVMRATTSGGPYASVVTGLNDTNYTDATVTNGVAYYYVISAVNPVGDTANSDEISARVPPPPLPVIESLAVSNGDLSITATNGGAGTWTLLQSTNLALPLNQWQTGGVFAFDANGNLSTNIPNAATNAHAFYILKQ